MVVPALVALAFGEARQGVAFVCGMGVCATLGSLLRLLKSYKIDRRRSLLLVGFAWIVIGVIAAVPLFLSGSFSSPFDALFDSVSALTTTGLTLAQDVDSLGYSQITWRVLLTFAGAQAVIVIAMYYGFFGQGAQPFVMEGRKDGERGRQRISESWRMVARVIGAFALFGTLAASIVCFTLGMSVPDAIMNGFWLAFNATSTGGFVPHTSDLVYYHSLALDIVLCISMFAGALSFGIFVYLRRGKYQRVTKNSELRTYMFWIVFLVVFVTFVMTREGIVTSIQGLLVNGMFTVISTATTSGMQTVYPEQIGRTLSDGVVILLCVAAMFGACAYSTGGGIKVIRILQVLRWIGVAILRRLLPSNAHVRMKYDHFGPQTLTSKDATLAMTVFILYLITAAIGSMFFIAHGNDALSSVLEAISCVSNCGISTGVVHPNMAFDLKVVSLLLMWLGRVEFIALIAAIVGIVLSLHPANLFSNRRSKLLREQKSKNSGGTAWRRRKQQKSTTTMGVLVVCALSLAALSVSVIPAATAAPGDSGGPQVSVQDVPALSDTETYHTVAVEALLTSSSRLDGKDVVFTAEAVGQAIIADDKHVWVNVKSDGAMIGVYMSKELAANIANYGGYARRGDTIEVKGTYHLACTDHNDELEVHADAVTVTQEGAHWDVAWSPAVLAIGILLIFVGAGLYALRMFLLRGRRRKHDI